MSSNKIYSVTGFSMLIIGSILVCIGNPTVNGLTNYASIVSFAGNLLVAISVIPIWFHDSSETSSAKVSQALYNFSPELFKLGAIIELIFFSALIGVVFYTDGLFLWGFVSYLIADWIWTTRLLWLSK